MVFLTVIGAVAVGVLVWAEWRHSPLRFIAKPAASACFVAVAVAGDATATGYGTWVLAALVLSTAGDVALLGRSSQAFIGGLAAFLLGHVAYGAGFSVRGLDLLALSVAALPVAVIAAVVIRWLLPSVPPDLKGPVIAYAVVISLMVASAASTVAGDFDGRIILGAGAFYLSDLAVARDRFVAPGFANRLWGLPLYYAAQFVLAWTV